MPHASSPKQMKSPAFIEKMNNGPVAFVTVLPNGPIAMGKSLGMWFGYAVLVGAVAGHVAGLTLGPGAEYLVVFHVVSAVAFAGYSLAILQSAIWWHRSWRHTLLIMFDGLVYALLTGGVFGWLWP